MKPYFYVASVRLLLILLVGCPYLLPAQTKIKKRSITDIQLVYDSLHVNGFDNSFPLHLLVMRHNGQQASTQGFKEGTLKWDQFTIRVENGIFQEGVIHYNWKKVYQNGHKITLHVSPKNNPALKAVFAIPVPYLTRMVIQPYGSFRLTPGYAYPFEIEGFYSNGQVYSTSASSAKPHKLSPADFRINYLKYSVRKNSVFVPTRLEPYPKNITITGTYLMDTTIVTQIEVPVDYTSHYTFNFIPEKANRGTSGENAVGGNRRNGRDGQDGQQGQRGQRGKTVKVYAQTIVVAADTLIKLKAIASVQSEHLLLHPKGRLLIDCRGGDGGDEGSGGDGSSGQDETDTEPAGYGGNGGDGGEGGQGGKVIIYTDSVTLAFIEKMITIENRGGKGGQEGVGGRRGREEVK